MTPIQFAVATLWVFYVLGMCIHVNVASALQAHGHAHKNGTQLYGIAEFFVSIIAAVSGALIWWWIA